MWAAVFRVIGQGLTSVTGGMARAAGSVASFEKIFGSSMFRSMTAANAFTKAMGALQSGFHGAMESAKQFSNLSLRLGIKPSEVASLAQFANDAGVSLAVLGKAVVQTQRFGQQVNISKPFKEVNKILGLTNDEIAKIREGGPEGMATLAEAMQNVTDEAQKMQILTKLYGGRGAMQMKQVLERDPNEIREGLQSFAADDMTIAANARIEGVVSKSMNMFKVLGQQLMSLMEPIIAMATSFGAELAVAFGFGIKWAATFFDYLRTEFAGFAKEVVDSKIGHALLGIFFKDEDINAYVKERERDLQTDRLYGEYKKEAREKAFDSLREQAAKIFGLSGVSIFGNEPFAHILKAPSQEIRFPQASDDDLLTSRRKAEMEILRSTEDRMNIEQRIALIRKESENKQYELAKKLHDLHEADIGLLETKNKALDDQAKEADTAADVASKKALDLQAQIAYDEAHINDARVELADLYNSGFGSTWAQDSIAAVAGTTTALLGAATIAGLGWTGVGAAAGGMMVGTGAYKAHQGVRKDQYQQLADFLNDPANLEDRQEFWADNPQLGASRRKAIDDKKADFVRANADALAFQAKWEEAQATKLKNTQKVPKNYEEWLEKNKGRKEIDALLQEMKGDAGKTASLYEGKHAERRMKDFSDFRDEVKFSERYRNIYLKGVEKEGGELARLGEERKFKERDMKSEAVQLAVMRREKQLHDEDLARQQAEVNARNEEHKKRNEQLELVPVTTTVGTAYTDEQIRAQRDKVGGLQTELADMVMKQIEAADNFSTSVGDSMRAVGGGGNIAAGPVSILSEMLDVQKEMRDIMGDLRTQLTQGGGAGQVLGDLSTYADDVLSTSDF